ISPSYLHSPGAPERVAQYNPRMRIILIVREPVARAISNHKHEVRIGHFQGDDLSFEAGLANNPSYVEQGRYAKHLRHWLAVFPREAVLVLDFDAVVGDPEGVMRSVCRFLGIGELPAGVDLHGKSNESYLVRSTALEGLKNGLRGLLEALRLGKVWARLGDAGLRSRYRRANRMAPEDAIGRPRPETLAGLKALYRPDIEELERLTGLSFDRWH
ncbi:MAG TPA: sulfotransferase domain-containing protein, partial [Woeseiaceae bacterium]|nr:sulfotransferase domain-containing protein [Woeseiaceae bacterium]